MKLQKNWKQILSEIGLLACGAAWGGGFVVAKGVMETIEPGFVLAIRFTIPAILVAPFLIRRFREAGRRTLLVAAISGFIQFFGVFFQMVGLTMTTAGNTAFITVFYVILVPIVMQVFNKERQSLLVYMAGAICLTGVGMIALRADFSVNTGDILVLVAAVFFAINIVLIAVSITGGMDVMVFSCVQFFFTGILSLAQGLVMSPLPPVSVFMQAEILWGLLYCIAIYTAFAHFVHNVALGFANPAHASLIMCTEALFGALFGMIFLLEEITLNFFIGALLVSASIILSELTKRRGSTLATYSDRRQ
jgi:drug/metabolite transporter (DMT)-like permease